MDSAALEEKIAAEEQRLQAVRAELSELAELARKLRVAEKEAEESVFKLKQQRTTVQEKSMRAAAQGLHEKLQKHDETLAELQGSYERTLQEKLRLHEEISKMTALPSTPAGVSRPTNLPNARFDLVAAAPVRSGSSTDPLGQVPVPTLNRQQQVTQARGARLEKTSLDTLGERPTASPLVNPADYIVNGPRPVTADREKGGRFSEWRPAGSRQRQPPGGASSMGAVLG